MNQAVSADVPAALARVQRKIEQWRQSHRPRAPWPDELWRQAAALARVHGINPIARALRLDYYALKKHVQSESAEAGKAAEQFLEILPGGMDGLSASRPRCTIEVEQAGGGKVRICLEGGELPDVRGLLPALLREGES
jgi:hypothetical protein